MREIFRIELISVQEKHQACINDQKTKHWLKKSKLLPL
tara:strand:+ start:27 stop:140 length:114 start_codon:yes stop_codon:yes gene_type:complete